MATSLSDFVLKKVLKKQAAKKVQIVEDQEEWVWNSSPFTVDMTRGIGIDLYQ